MHEVLAKLEGDDRRSISRSEEIVARYLNDQSRIVRTFAMQALAELAEGAAALRPQVIELLEDPTRTGSPTMQSRGRRLLDGLRRTRGREG